MLWPHPKEYADGAGDDGRALALGDRGVGGALSPRLVAACRRLAVAALAPLLLPLFCAPRHPAPLLLLLKLVAGGGRPGAARRRRRTTRVKSAGAEWRARAAPRARLMRLAPPLTRAGGPMRHSTRASAPPWWHAPAARRVPQRAAPCPRLWHQPPAPARLSSPPGGGGGVQVVQQTASGGGGGVRVGHLAPPCGARHSLPGVCGPAAPPIRAPARPPHAWHSAMEAGVPQGLALSLDDLIKQQADSYGKARRQKRSGGPSGEGGGRGSQVRGGAMQMGGGARAAVAVAAVWVGPPALPLTRTSTPSAGLRRRRPRPTPAAAAPPAAATPPAAAAAPRLCASAVWRPRSRALYPCRARLPTAAAWRPATATAAAAGRARERRRRRRQAGGRRRP